MAALLPTAITFTSSYLLGRIVDQGAANALGLATLRHGTNPLAWVSIHIVGGCPQLGGTQNGGNTSAACHQQCLNNMYFARGNHYIQNSALRKLCARFIPRAYTFTSTYHLIHNTGFPDALAKIAGFVTAILLPPIRYRASQEEVEYEMTQVASMSGHAVSTNRWVAPWKLGTIGTLYSGLSTRIFSRISQNKERIITGLFQLSVAAAIGYYSLPMLPFLMAYHKTAILAGLAFGMI